MLVSRQHDTLADRFAYELADRLDLMAEGKENEWGSVDQSYVGVHQFRRFARDQLKVIDRQSGDVVPFRLNWIQRQILAAEIRAVRNGVTPWFIILKYRRGGVTTLQQGLCYQTVWAKQHSFVGTLAHRTDDTRQIFRMVDRFYDHQPEEYQHERTTASILNIEFPKWDSVYKAETAGAQGAFRGSRLDRVHLSEAASYIDLRTVHKALTDAVEERPYVIESTPNGQEGRGQAFYEFWQAAKRGESAFIPLFFPWHSDPRNALPLRAPDELGELSDEEAQLAARFNLALPQVKWWRVKRKALVAGGRSSSSIHQEHPSDDESCFVGTGESYFDGKLIDDAYGMCRPPIELGDLQGDYPDWVRRDIENGHLRIFQEPQEGARYVIGSDPAEGVGGDDSAAVGFNDATGEQAFSWARNDIPPDEFGSWILCGKPSTPHRKGLGWIWRGSELAYPALQVVERNNHGHAVLTGMIGIAEYPTELIHHDVDPTRPDEPASKRPGWAHNHIQLTQAAGRVLREHFPVIRDNAVVQSFQKVANEKNVSQFTGRDLAVAATVAAIGMELRARIPTLAFIGGKWINTETWEEVPPDQVPEQQDT